ncbi:hypothetical protein ACFWYW_23850 [Nonomuraea sp. NPDC059023]|uniref:hypothetical protein n=1 Tax=unclassified Nonomuraea TaxID=2593643 RepID=UPI0036C73F7E
MARKLAPAKTPTVALARVLRSLGLKQGEDFRIEGIYNRFTINGKGYKERHGTRLGYYSTHAARVIWDNAEHIEAATEAEGYGFYVRTTMVTNAGNRLVSVNNQGSSDLAEARCRERAAAYVAKGMDSWTAREAAEITPANLARFTLWVINSRGTWASREAIASAFDNADQTLAAEGIDSRCLVDGTNADRWASLIFAAYEDAQAIADRHGCPLHSLPTVEHPGFTAWAGVSPQQ